jgi:hypothetical protein
MALSTSPYQQNDYQAASAYRPYRLPVNDILHALSAQDQFWDDGARRIRSYYDNAMGLNLTLDENKQVRKDFMDNATKQLDKLSSMNVSDPSVQKQGMDIFKPLYQDESILLDDQITSKRNQIIADAQRFKNDRKNQGEGYSQDNLLYALQGFKDFGSGTSRGQLRDIYGKVSGAEYTPYHDVSKEYMDLAAKCKPDKMEGTTAQGLYFDTQTDDSLTSTKLNACIKGGLSDKAWNQLKITGSVRYGQNYGAIAQGYAPILEGNNQANAESLVQLSAQREKLRKAGKMSDQLEQAYKDQEDQINTNILHNKAQLGRLKAGDYTDIQKNYDNIISQVYGNQDIGSFAQAFSYVDKSEKLSANAAGIAQFNQANENARFNSTLSFQQQKFATETEMKQHEMDLNLYKTLMGEGGGASGKGGLGAATYQMLAPIMQRLGIPMDMGITSMLGDASSLPNQGETLESINQKANEFHHERTETGLGIYNTLKELGLPDESLKRLLNEKGQLNVESAYQMADQYLTAFHNTTKDKDGKPLNSSYANKVDQIMQLEDMTNKYNDSRSKVWEFMKMRDDIQKRLDSNPALKKALGEINQQTEQAIQKGFNYQEHKLGFGENHHLGYFFKDSRKGRDVIFEEDDFRKLASGTHPDYSLNKNGELIYRSDGSFVMAGDRTSQDSKNMQLLTKQTGRNYVAMENGTGIMKEIAQINQRRTNEVNPYLSGAVKDVVRNQMVYGVGNVPGLANSVKQTFASVLPTLNSPDYQVRPGKAYKDNSGNWVTTVEVFHKKEKKADAEDGDSYVDSYKQVDAKDIQQLFTDQHIPLGGTDNDVNIQNGVITVKTPYLPMAKGDYPLQQVVDNQLYRAKKLTLGYNEKASQEVKRLSGGFKIGFDAIGQGSSAYGEQKPKSYKVWFMTPDGQKEYFNSAPLYADNEVSNNLSLLEQRFPSILEAYQKRKTSN